MSLASRMAALALPALLAGCEMGAPVVGLREGHARGNDSCAVPSDLLRRVANHGAYFRCRAQP